MIFLPLRALPAGSGFIRAPRHGRPATGQAGRILPPAAAGHADRTGNVAPRQRQTGSAPADSGAVPGHGTETRPAGARPACADAFSGPCMLLTGISEWAATQGVSPHCSNTLRDHRRCRATWGSKHWSKDGDVWRIQHSSSTRTLNSLPASALRREVRDPGSSSQDCSNGCGRGTTCAAGFQSKPEASSPGHDCGEASLNAHLPLTARSGQEFD
jgi:hypothetical protein